MKRDLCEAEQTRRSRYIIRTLLFFWPVVDSADDVDRVTRLGYTVCLAVLAYTAVSMLPDLVNLDWIAWATLALLLVLYFVGANAVRQKSTLVAATLCLMHAFAIPYAYLLHRTFPYQSCTVLLALLLVWRGVALAAEFQASPSDAPPLLLSDILPPRSRTRLARYFTDTLPARIWPAYQPLFWTATLLILSAELYGAYAFMQMHARA